MKIVSISDTHNFHSKVTIPECDILIHSGDATFQGKDYELERFAQWLQVQPAEHIVFVPGNHEVELEKYWLKGTNLLLEICPRLTILNDSGITINNKKIWGTPVTPFFHNWAWNRAIKEEYESLHGRWIKHHYDLIPDDTDILITHGPPYLILDSITDGVYTQHLGDPNLNDALSRVKPDLHFFGHIHEGYGQVFGGKTKYINSSVCDGHYKVVNEPMEIIYE